MKPTLASGNFAFCSISQEEAVKSGSLSVLVFKENEGVTVVLEKAEADARGFSYDGVWSLITLSIHSSLSAIGFLAAVTGKLAEAGISVNAVSAYYHDHLFVPADKAEEAMRLLEKLSKE